MRTRSPSENLCFGLEQPDQLRNCGSPFANNAPRFPFGWQLEPSHDNLWFRQLRRLHVEWLFLRCHDAFERWKSRGIETFVDGEDRGQRKLHHFLRAFQLSLRCSLSVRDFERRDGGDARESEQLGGHGSDDAIG